MHKNPPYLFYNGHFPIALFLCDIFLHFTSDSCTMDRREEGSFVRPLQISAETAQKLAESLNLPLEQIMHMPQHILLAKMAELQKEDKS
nr:unknown [Bacillus subtilis] [Bacillus subtilis subsp. subtilis str. 168]